MTAHRRTARVLVLGAALSATAAVYAATFHPWLIVFGLYSCGAFAWIARGYYRAHRRALAEADWERRHALGEHPAPLNPCCELADHSDGAAHDRRKCTNAFHRITSDPTHDHRSAT